MYFYHNTKLLNQTKYFHKFTKNFITFFVKSDYVFIGFLLTTMTTWSKNEFIEE